MITPRIGVRSAGVCFGERELTISELSAHYSLPADIIERSLGKRRVRVTDGPITELAVNATRTCLERAAVRLADVGAIVWAGTAFDGLRLQHALGIERVSVFLASAMCPEFPNALLTATTLAGRGCRNILIASGDFLRTNPRSSVRPAQELAVRQDGFRELVSDAGSAVLVSRVDEGDGSLEFSGLGSATNGRFWDYFSRRRPEGEGHENAFSDDIAMLRETLPMHQRALADCLTEAHATIEHVDDVILPLEPGSLNVSYAKWVLRISPEKVVQVDECSHVGFADPIIGLEKLLRRGRPAPGAGVLVVAKTPGIVRCAFLGRVGPETAPRSE